MANPRSAPTMAETTRRRYLSTHRAYHTADPTPPKVFHTDLHCPGGQQIPARNLRGGRGRRRRPCRHC